MEFWSKSSPFSLETYKESLNLNLQIFYFLLIFYWNDFESILINNNLIVSLNSTWLKDITF